MNFWFLRDGLYCCKRENFYDGGLLRGPGSKKSQQVPSDLSEQSSISIFNHPHKKKNVATSTSGN